MYMKTRSFHMVHYKLNIIQNLLLPKKNSKQIVVYINAFEKLVYHLGIRHLEFGIRFRHYIFTVFPNLKKLQHTFLI